ncbi:MAG TPA: 2-iminoacetate synthase ThiH [Chitinivibrionales bacterium]|nr:2-iminoacetate synthase ThiH [Chitinivibrionales bacterium]
MSFYDAIKRYAAFDFAGYNASVTPQQIESILDKDKLVPLDYLALLSDAASSFLEPMAQRARSLTKKNFGNVMFLFTPLYISDHCDNGCPYCSFARQHRIGRNHLSFEKIRAEAGTIAATGMRHLLVLTGESRSIASPEYIREAVSILSDSFSSVSIEVYPMTQEEYSAMVASGADGLTMYQEVYNEAKYHELHRGGPKDNYRFRLDAPDRAASAGVRAVTVGALMGLFEPRSEAFFTGLHAQYMQKTHPSVETSVAFPRLRPMVRDFEPYCKVSDRQYVQLLLAARLFLPRCGITVSTRESKPFRNAIAPLGVTKMSAGVSTAVGGHAAGAVSTPQFDIADVRSLEEMKKDLVALGFQPVLQDWNSGFLALREK